MARITMPQLGETVTEGTVTRWLKAVGDMVEVDDPLLEVSTDKVDTEVPSALRGVLRHIAVAEGDTVPIGAVLCSIGDESPDDDRDADHLSTESARSGSDDRRRFELEYHQARLDRPRVDRPRVDRADRFEARTSDTGRAAAASPTSAGEPTAEPTGVSLPDLEISERVPFTTIRRRTATHLIGSLRTAAHTLTTVEVDYSSVDRARSAANGAFRDREGFGLSYLPFVARAVCDSLLRFPRLNASVGNDELVIWRSVNLGIAVDLDHQGLVVPVVDDASSKRLTNLARIIHDLADDARAHRLGADAFASGTFTITNAGGYGTVVTVPVINTPQVAILSIDGIAPRPVAVADGDGGWAVTVRPMGNLSLSFDHRANDGAYASAFLAAVRSVLETRDWAAELAGGLP